MEASLQHIQCVRRTACRFREIPRKSHFSRVSSLSFSALPCRSSYAATKIASRQGSLRVESVKRGIEAVFAGEGREEERVAEEEEEEEHGNSMSSVAGGELSCVMKFGGSSVASAERMREIAQLILGFPEENPVIVLSAMGKTTNHLLLVRAYLRCGFGASTALNFVVLFYKCSCWLVGWLAGCCYFICVN